MALKKKKSNLEGNYFKAYSKVTVSKPQRPKMTPTVVPRKSGRGLVISSAQRPTSSHLYGKSRNFGPDFRAHYPEEDYGTECTKPQSIQLLEENRQFIHDLGRDKYFLERVQKA